MNWTIIFLCQLGLPDCSSINLEVLFCLDYDWTVYESWWVYLALESCWVFLAMFIRNEMHQPDISFFCGFRVCKTRFIVVKKKKKRKLCLITTVCVVDELNSKHQKKNMSDSWFSRYLLCCVRLSMIHLWLVVWNMNLIFPYIGNFIIPTDELTPSFFRGVGWNHQFHVSCGKIPREVFCQWFLWAEFRTGSPDMSWNVLSLEGISCVIIPVYNSYVAANRSNNIISMFFWVVYKATYMTRFNNHGLW